MTTAPRRRRPGESAPAGGKRRAAWGSGPCGWWRGGGPSSCFSWPSRCSSSRPRGSALRLPLPRPSPASAGSTRLRVLSMACANLA
uniref:Uncharacterized protein n=1 Tax=Arundo donax TaxID=35708 RepID=A0A0A9CPW8_ARUDO